MKKQKQYGIKGGVKSISVSIPVETLEKIKKLKVHENQPAYEIINKLVSDAEKRQKGTKG